LQQQRQQQTTSTNNNNPSRITVTIAVIIIIDYHSLDTSFASGSCLHTYIYRTTHHQIVPFLFLYVLSSLSLAMTPLDLFKWKQGIESDADPDLPMTPHLTEYSNDNGLDIDDYTDCTESIMSHYTSAGGSVTKYKKQLALNQIQDLEGALDLDHIGFKTQFDDEVRIASYTLTTTKAYISLTWSTKPQQQGLDTFASTVPLEVLERASLDLDHMRNDFNKGAYIKEEFALHIDLTIQLGRLIDINPNTIQGGGRKLFAVTAPGSWNRAPLCLVDAGYKNLSQPKVDISFALAWDQDKIDQSSPLWEICSEFLDKEELARTVGLLSLGKMKELNAYEEFADVSSG
jgi:hypothetical protein